MIHAHSRIWFTPLSCLRLQSNRSCTWIFTFSYWLQPKVSHSMSPNTSNIRNRQTNAYLKSVMLENIQNLCNPGIEIIMLIYSILVTQYEHLKSYLVNLTIYIYMHTIYQKFQNAYKLKIALSYYLVHVCIWTPPQQDQKLMYLDNFWKNLFSFERNFEQKKTLTRVRIELTTSSLWDRGAAYWATKALVS